MRGRTNLHHPGTGENPGIEGRTYTKERRAATPTRLALQIRYLFTRNVLREKPVLSTQRCR